MHNYISPKTEIIITSSQTLLAGSDPASTDIPGSGEQLAKPVEIYSVEFEDEQEPAYELPKYSAWDD